MKVDVSVGEGLKREVSVEIPSETVQAEMDAQYAEVRKTAHIKGFRKGKAPMDMIKKMYEDEVRADVADKILRNSLPEAITKQELKVASRPTLTWLDFTEDGGLAYKAEVEVFPEVDKIVFDGLEVDDVKVEVKDREVEDVIDQFLFQRSEMRKLERPAELGDILVADLVKLEDPKGIVEQDKFENSGIDLGSPVTVKEFKEVLPGIKAGEEREVTAVYPDDYTDPKFAGASIKYLVQVKSVNERIVPQLTDSMVEALGIDAKTVLEFKLKIRENMAAEREDEVKRSHRQALVEQMSEKNPLVVPEGLIEEYLDAVVGDFQKQAGEGSQLKADDIRKHYRPIGVQTMRWDMIWRHLAEQEKIEVLPSDTENWISNLARQNNMTMEQAQQAVAQSGKASQLRDSILEEKVLDFLQEKAARVTPKEEE